jgi:hypothetical protein
LKLTPILVVLFFVPVVNLLFFTLLTMLPDADVAPARGKGEAGARHEMAVAYLRYGQLRRPLTRSYLFLCALIPVLPATMLTMLSTLVLRNYGWGLFVGTPFAVSMTAGVLCGRREGVSSGKIFLCGMLSLVFWVVGLFVAQFEGAICLVMAAPLVLIVGGLGALSGVALHKAVQNVLSDRHLLSLLIVLGGGMVAEAWSRHEAPTFTVTTCVDVNAGREAVWEHVVSFPPLPEPREWLFRHGVAYPTRASISGKGKGAQRRCEFSTGTFLEPITVWQEPALLRFDVTENPVPLREWSWTEIHPPHLHGFFVSRQGQFRLFDLGEGRTRLEGVTWYQHHMWPAAYWSLWADYVVHRIHRRVLDHIKVLAEGWNGERALLVKR